MLDDSVLAGILKWAALALVLAAGLWKLVAPRPDREDIDGRKRFTMSGIVTLAIMIGGIVVSGLSLWIETVVKQKDAAETARDKEKNERIQAKSAADLDITKANTAKSVAEIAAARLEGRAAADDAFRRETRERLRDLELAESVAAGARDNLARTGEALTQIERVLQPLEPMTVTVIWEIPADVPDLAAATARIAAGARVAEALTRAEWERRSPYRRPDYVPLTTLRVTPDDPLYPDPNRRGETRLAAELRRPHTDLALFAAGASSATALARGEPTRYDLHKIGDLKLHLQSIKPMELEYQIATGAVHLIFDQTTPLQRGRAIVSMPDVERAFGIMALGPGRMLAQARPISVTLRGTTRNYDPPVAAMRRIAVRQPRAVFTLPPLTPMVAP